MILTLTGVVKILMPMILIKANGVPGKAAASWQRGIISVPAVTLTIEAGIPEAHWKCGGT